MRPFHWFGLACLATLAGCAGVSPPSSGPPASTGPTATTRPSDPVPTGPLQAESRWLSELFSGTPVGVSGDADGSVLVKVPMQHAFDAAQARRPLVAVLDKVAQSLKRQPAARLQAATPGPAAAERLATLRSLLAERGVGNWRVTAGPAAADAVHLRLLPPPGTGLRRLDDASLPATGAGRITPPR